MGVNGQYPTLAMNNRGWVIQTYHRETVINLRLRYKIGYLRENQIHWNNHHAAYSKGYFPRIAMNDGFVVVTVFTHQISKQLFCRIGKLRVEMEEGSQSLNSSSIEESTTTPGSNTNSPLVKNKLPQLGSQTEQGSHQPLPPDEDVINGASIEWWGEKIMFGEGRNPAVSISKNNTVVIVYERGNLNIQTKYRIGRIEGRELKWLDSDEGGKGLILDQSSKHASIAINDKGQVAIGYSSGVERVVHYRAGRISSSNSIVLGDEVFSPFGVNYQPVVSLNNHGHVVAVHHTLQGRLYLKISYGVMKTDSMTGQSSIEWSLETPSNFAFDGYHGSVSVTDEMKVITTYKSLTLHIHKSIRNRVGQLSC